MVNCNKTYLTTKKNLRDLKQINFLCVCDLNMASHMIRSHNYFFIFEATLLFIKIVNNTKTKYKLYKKYKF